MKSYNVTIDLEYCIISESYVNNVFKLLTFKHIVNDIVTYKNDKIYHPGKVFYTLPHFDLIHFKFDKNTINNFEKNKDKAILSFDAYKKLIINNISSDKLVFRFSDRYTVKDTHLHDILDVPQKPYVLTYFIFRNLENIYNDYIKHINNEYDYKDIVVDYYKSYIKLCEFLGYRDIMSHLINFISYRFIVHDPKDYELASYMVKKLNLENEKFSFYFLVDDEGDKIMKILTNIHNKFAYFVFKHAINTNTHKYYDEKSNCFVLKTKVKPDRPVFNPHIYNNVYYEIEVSYDEIISRTDRFISDSNIITYKKFTDSTIITPVSKFLINSNYTFKDIEKQVRNKEVSFDDVIRKLILFREEKTYSSLKFLHIFIDALTDKIHFSKEISQYFVLVAPDLIFKRYKDIFIKNFLDFKYCKKEIMDRMKKIDKNIVHEIEAMIV